MALEASRNLRKEFYKLLKFYAQLCVGKEAFISIKKEEKHEICAKIGLETLNCLEQLGIFDAVLQASDCFAIKDIISTDVDLLHSNDKNFNFLLGFPIRLRGNTEVVATLCVFAKDSSIVELDDPILQHIIMQVKTLLQMHNANAMLKKALDMKELQKQNFVNNAKELFYQFDVAGNFIFASQNFKTMLGYSKDDLLGTNFAPLLHPEDVQAAVSFLDNLRYANHHTGEHSYRIRHADGHYVWQISTVSVVTDSKKTYFLGVAREVTKFVEGQKELRKQKEFYERILNQLPTAIAVYDGEFRYKFLNPAAIKNEELRKFAIGKTNFEYEKHVGRDPSFALNRQRKFDEAILTKKTLEWEDEIFNKEIGSFVYHQRNLTPVFNKDGSVEMIIGIGISITDVRKANTELLKAKEFTSSIVQNVAVGILVQGPDSEIFENNAAACEMLGLTEDQLLGKTSFDQHWRVSHLDGTNFNSEDHPVPQAIKTGKRVSDVVMGVFRPMTNDFVWLLVDAVPVFDAQNNLLHVVCSFNNITIRKEVEDSLKDSNERFSYATMATSDIVWDWDLLKDSVSLGENYTTLFGDQFQGSAIQMGALEQLIHPDDKDQYYKNINSAIEGDGFRWSDEYRILGSNNSYCYINDRAIIVRNTNGTAIRMIGAMHDSTIEKSLKIKLQKSEEQFKGAFDNSGVGMAIVDLDGSIKVVNKGFTEILGYSDQEATKLNISDISMVEDVEDDQMNLMLLQNGEINMFTKEKKYTDKYGNIIWAILTVSAVRNDKNEPIQFISQIIDITQKKKVEEANIILLEENRRSKALQLIEAKNLYRLLADNMVDLVCVHALDGTLQYVSPSCYLIFGYYSENLIGMSPVDFVHPDDEVALKLVFSDLRYFEHNHSVRARFRKEDGSYTWCELKGRVVKEDGIPVNFYSSTRDITETKNAEIAIEQSLGRERELNELRANLVSTVSHEFRTPMTTIRSSAELIMIYLQDQQVENFTLLEKRINIIISEIDRIVSLMNTILVIAKDDLGKTNFFPTVFDLKQACLNVIEISEFDQKGGRKVIATFTGNDFFLNADKGLMEYILFNLINNAFKYSQNVGGNVLLNLIETDTEVVLEVVDFGIGIPAEDQPKLFNTFYRASNTHGIQGTGLGLYIVKTFTERNSGNFKLESVLGEGTKVTLCFPKKDKSK